MTINPLYSYTDIHGNVEKVGLMEKGRIPKGSKRRMYKKYNICDNRIRALKHNEVIDETTGKVTIQPKICDMNLKKVGSHTPLLENPSPGPFPYEGGKEPKSLYDEPGIPDFKKLYMDADYNERKGTFVSMSDESRRQYESDLELFYNAFTGNTMTSETKAQIKDFSDIKLRDYRKSPICQSQNQNQNGRCTLSRTSELYVKYAENVQKMTETAADNQSQLLEIINALFTYVVDPHTKKRVILINPKLNNTTLQENIVKARKIISKLYIECEEHYVEGVKIYEAIVEAKICETTQRQIEHLEAESNQLIQGMT
jgi:hypothetical protein